MIPRTVSLVRPSLSAATRARAGPSIAARGALNSRRSVVTLNNTVTYTARARAWGGGRNGKAASNGDAPLELEMCIPKAMGGKGKGQNPEQLFAMAYSTCFLGALRRAAAAAGKADEVANAQVHASVRIGHPEQSPVGRFGLEVEIDVDGIEDDAIISSAHEFCPYSRMLRHGANVTIKKL